MGYSWKEVTHIIPGDFIHRWGEDLKVIDTHREKLKIILDVQDGKEIKNWEYKLDAELMVKVREVQHELD